jgi:transposase
VTRFRSEAASPRFASVCPLSNWSGRTAGRLPLAAAGQVPTALHQIATVQIRDDHAEGTNYRKRLNADDTPAQARRCLKRRLARVV